MKTTIQQKWNLQLSGLHKVTTRMIAENVPNSFMIN